MGFPLGVPWTQSADRQRLNRLLEAVTERGWDARGRALPPTVAGRRGVNSNMNESERDPLARLWGERMRMPFPPNMCGREIEGEGLVYLDASIAGGITPSIDDEGAAIEYYERLRETAASAADFGNDGPRWRPVVGRWPGPRLAVRSHDGRVPSIVRRAAAVGSVARVAAVRAPVPGVRRAAPEFPAGEEAGVRGVRVPYGSGRQPVVRADLPRDAGGRGASRGRGPLRKPDPPRAWPPTPRV